MKRYFLWCGVALLLVAPLHARQQAPAEPKIVLDVWDAVYVNGAKMGYQHTTVEQQERDGKKIFHTTRYLSLTLKRYDGVITQRMALATDETPEGKVVGVSMTHYLDKDRKVVQSGRVEGDKLIVQTPGGRQSVPWREGVIGYYAQERLFQDRKAKAGDRFRFLDYQLPLLTAVPQDVIVKEPEEKEVLTAKKDGDEVKGVNVRKRLLRVEILPEKVKLGDNTIPLPRLVLWLDEKLRVVRQESNTPLGLMTLYRTPRALAEKEGVAPALMADFGLNSRIRLNRPIDHPYQAHEIVYRITVKDDDDPTTTFTRDGRQTVENVHGNTFDLRVRAVREPAEGEHPDKVKEEFLKSSYFLDSGNEKIREQAAEIAGDQTDPWRKAQRIEKWVHEHMKGSNEINFAPASQVLNDLQGDCRQHAMLTAALCRAAGVPARTAVGLVYSNERDLGPVLAFHMWTEVWIKGQWLMLDAVLGHGNVGAAHLKIADHSWQDIQTLAPLLPVTRVTGKVRVEVVSVK
ncbi:MAG TPA: transglutaminase-like domain-containing protein [Gemmataceae bacterium]|nr:transglutaminase-like domain-containing protein [Gemmataceae bacterium]